MNATTEGISQHNLLAIIDIGEREAIGYDPSAHPFGCLHLVWGIRDAVNAYFNADDKEAFMREVLADRALRSQDSAAAGE